ncbi:MAG: sugar phosphorylase [Gammaproteobacteria bacterium]
MALEDEYIQRLRRSLNVVYPDGDADAVLTRLLAVCQAHRDALAEHPSPHTWDEQDAVLITYGGSIQVPGERPLRSLRDFLRRRLMGTVNTVHILPFFPYSSDDGFSVIDYREVDEELGDWEDVHALAEDFFLMGDLVLNHCSRRSLWFSDYVAGTPPYDRYFVEGDPADDLALVVRPRSTPLLWKVRTHRGVRHVWGTFSDDQIDLDYRNPDVLLEMIDILLFYVRSGCRIVRLDAVAFLWKEVGTSCIHLPQTHEVVKLFRTVLEAVAPHAVLLTETNVPHHENRGYFGDLLPRGDAHVLGDEAQMIYQFSLPPLLLHALHTGYTSYLHQWAKSLEEEPPPPGCTYLNFTASHDGVGLRGLEGLVPEKEIKNLLHAMHARGGYVSMRRREDGREAPYELNISYYEAFREPGLEHDPFHIPCFLVSQLVALSLQGIPALYIHSFTATPNDHYGVELTGRTRAINRRRWDAGELNALLDNPETEHAKVFNALTHALRVRREHPAFHPDGPQRVLDLGHHLFGVVRFTPDGHDRVLCLYNFTPDTRSIPVDLECFQGGDGISARWRDLLSGDHPRIERGHLQLAGYCALWLCTGTRDCGPPKLADIDVLDPPPVGTDEPNRPSHG